MGLEAAQRAAPEDEAPETGEHEARQAAAGVGRVLQVNISAGGVPKLPIPSARVSWLGLDGDGHREATLHGGPHRAVCLFAIEAIRRVAAEGHPIEPGSAGENLTTEGIELSTLPVGTRLRVGRELLLELASPDGPCKTIRESFSDGRFSRISIEAHPTDSRMYARVIREGIVSAGDPIEVLPPAPDSRAETQRLLFSVDAAERSSAAAMWRAAAEAGHDLRIVADGELAMVAAPGLPGPAFNAAHGLRTVPEMLGRVESHFRGHGTVGWLTSDRSPWPGIDAERRFTIVAADATAVETASAETAVAERAVAERAVAEPASADQAISSGPASIRRLEPDEAGTWADVLVAASALAPTDGAAWRDLAGPLARGAHTTLYVAEAADGRPLGVASLHTHRGVGHLRATAVLPAARGRGIQRALIRARVAAAAALGCELVAASAIAGSASERNLIACGLRPLAVYGQYRFDPRA